MIAAETCAATWEKLLSGETNQAISLTLPPVLSGHFNVARTGSFAMCASAQTNVFLNGKNINTHGKG
jgi:fatty acid-binding protein DegV